MTKTVSARIDSDEYDKVLDLANEEGLTANDTFGSLVMSLTRLFLSAYSIIDFKISCCNLTGKVPVKIFKIYDLYRR